MAAQNLTASALTYIQARLTEMFSPDQTTPSRYPWVDHIETARSMLREHSANISPITNAQGDCVAYKVYWLKKGADTIVHNSTPAGYTVAADLTSGQGPVSVEKSYTNNFKIVSLVEIDDDICGNVFKNPGSPGAEQAATLIQNRLMTAMYDIRSKLNTKWVNFLDTNKTSVNNDSSLPAGVSFGSSLYSVTTGTLSMQEPDTLTDLAAIAANNDLQDYFWIGGRYHFYNAVVNSDYRRLNDAERDHIRFDDWRMYFDIKNLDNTLSGQNSFVVDPGSYVFWDHVNDGRTRQPEQVKDLSFEYYIEDPMLLVNDNGLLRPLRYNVYYQQSVNSAGNTTEHRRTKTHRWEVTLHGGQYVAPPAEDNHTGILKFKSA